MIAKLFKLTVKNKIIKVKILLNKNQIQNLQKMKINYQINYLMTKTT